MQKKVILEKTPMYFHRIIQNSESHSQSYFDFNKHVCYIKSVNTLLQYTLTFHLYCLEFYMGAGKLLMSGILNSLIANKSMREFICRIRLLKSDAIFASIFHFYIIPRTDKWLKRYPILLYSVSFFYSLLHNRYYLSFVFRKDIVCK